MRIAQLAHIIERVPPKKYGGTERIIQTLTEGLVKRGHDVTLFATGDSTTSANLVSVVSHGLKEMKAADPYGPNALTALHYGKAYKMQDEFDIIHDHLGNISLPTANLATTPVVMTMHGPFTRELLETYNTLNKPYIVTISKKQYEMGPKMMNHARTIYHGLEMEHYPFSKKHDGYLLFVGRITIEKGVHYAIQVARALDLPLIIAAKLETYFQPDVEYFERYVKPYLSDKIRWVGEVDEKQRNKLMSKAMAFLHPVTWPEPFGLTLIESMGCGTPVIAFRQGSIPEVIKHGRTGFVADHVSEMIEYVKQIPTIDRTYCRKYALTMYSAERMVSEYEALYRKILAQKVAKEIRIPQKPFSTTPFLQKPMDMKSYD